MGAVVTAIMTAFFRGQMKRLIGLKFAPADLTTHWEALGDLPDDLVVAAVDRAQRECSEFPSPAQLMSYVDQARRAAPVPQGEDRGVELIAPVVIGVIPQTGTVIKAKREWRYYCEDCSDSGWRSIWCGDQTYAKPWQERGVCGRHGDHGAHEFVAVCPCASSNPDIRRRKERQSQATRRSTDD
jgi:hypothetical protein